MKIKKTGLLLGACALGVFSPNVSFAADLPVKAAVAPAYYDWSGVYVGVHAGYGGGMQDWQGDFIARGFLGGGQVGINKQLGSLVFGLELDGSWADMKGSQTVVEGGPILNFLASRTAASKIDGIVTLAGRAGLAADRWFVFAKGGVAYVNEGHSLTIAGGSFVPPVVDSLTTGGNEYRIAPLVGFGAEYALGGNWSVKGEYNYIHLGSRHVGMTGSLTTGGVTTPVVFDQSIEQAIHVAKVGVNYRLGGIQSGPTFAPVPAAPGYNWSGAYVGGQGGYGLGRNEWPDFVDPTIPNSGKYDVDGWLAGVTGGVNAQAGKFVFGIEGEWMWTNIKGSRSITQEFPGFGSQTTSLDTRIDWLAIAAARAGFVVADRLLIYGKAGVAIAQEQHGYNFDQVITGVGSATEPVKAKAIHTGVVGGVGAEYAVGGNWSVKIEYDYIRMLGQQYTGTGIQTLNVPPLLLESVATVHDFGQQSQDLHLIKFGVNYHFSQAPVVVSARY
jgi:outer membrane immunogenic protein